MTTLAELVVAKTKSTLLSAALSLAESLGVPVTNWQIGEPSEAIFQHVSEEIAALETVFVNFTKSAFLDYCSSDPTLYSWLVIVADQVYGYTARTATYATCTVRLTNTKGGIYSFDIGDIIVKTAAGVTYHNTESGTILGGSLVSPTTLDLQFEADISGSIGTCGAGDIDEMVTVYLGVECLGVTSPTGQDAEPASSIVAGCRAKLGRMTNGGPRDAYVSVALDSSLTGTTVPTRARVTSNSRTGAVTVCLASTSGTVAAGDLTKVADALNLWATPLCISVSVVSATPTNYDITYAIAAYKSWGVTSTEAHNLITAAVQKWFSERPIGGDIIPPAIEGVVTANMVVAAIRSASDKIIRVDLVYPDDLPLSVGASSVLVCTSVVLNDPIVWVDDP